ncbi:unnamed protein product [Didymodactylos carnosus]|nr:unnamed protein product [Didymodactylos carnosus]CAF4332974.1 unnamed protein product [Didymodactylos carnosus]
MSGKDDTCLTLASTILLIYCDGSNNTEDLFASICDIPLDEFTGEVTQALVKFYYKYKHLGYAQPARARVSNLGPMAESSFLCDFVGALKLNFWPSDVVPFLNRLRDAKPKLSEGIKRMYMHIVSKPPETSSEGSKRQPHYFRYSFSFIEQYIA